MTKTPKSLLHKRTQAQFDFDMGIKGWAFMKMSSTFADHALALYLAIGRDDPERLKTLQHIQRLTKN